MRRAGYAGGVAVAPDIEDDRLLHAGALMALFGVGMYASAFGPALPFIAEDLGVSLDTAGLVLTAFFLGSISASATIAIALHRHHPRTLAAWGVAAAGTGAVLVGAAPTWPAALLGAAVLGVGDGLVVAALHILMSVTSRDVPSAMNRLNLFFAFGAMLGPLWAGALLAASGERWIVFSGIGGYEGITLLVLLASRAPAPRQDAMAEEGFVLPGNPTAWVMGAVLFLYVGAEFGLGAWVSSYARASADAGVFAAALLTSGYWSALALGRVISGVYFTRGREASLLLAVSIAGAGVSSLVLALSSGNIALSAVSVFGAGLFLGPIWPATIAIASEDALAHATAATVTMGNAGGVAIPWVQGRVLVGAGPTQGVAVTAALSGVMFVIVAAFRARRRLPG